MLVNAKRHQIWPKGKLLQQIFGPFFLVDLLQGNDRLDDLW